MTAPFARILQALKSTRLTGAKRELAHLDLTLMGRIEHGESANLIILTAPVADALAKGGSKAGSQSRRGQLH